MHCYSSKSFRLHLLKDKVPNIIVLFFKTFLFQDVSGVILQFWWKLFSCEYIHKYCSNFIFAARHIKNGEIDQNPIELIRCLKCGNVQYLYSPFDLYGELQKNMFFPTLSPGSWLDYKLFIIDNIRRNNKLFHFKFGDYKFIKKFTMQEFQKLLGIKPLAWNEPEALLLPYYKVIPFKKEEVDLQETIKRKRWDNDDLFMNKKQRLV